MSESPLDQEPALSGAQQSALDAILAAKAEKGLSITRTLEGTDVTFQFHPVMSVDALRVVAAVDRLQKRKNAPMDEQLEKMVEFLDAMALPDSARFIAALVRAGAMTIGDLADLQREVVTAVAARPTTRPSSSPDGSPDSGENSTE